jgi:hypothetical protein
LHGDRVLQRVGRLHVLLVVGIEKGPEQEKRVSRPDGLFIEDNLLRAVFRPDRVVLTDDHQRLVAVPRVGQADGQRRGQVEDRPGIERVPVGTDRVPAGDIGRFPQVSELPERVHVLDIVPHLEVGLRTDVILNRHFGSVCGHHRETGNDRHCAMSAVTTKVVWIRMLFLRFLGSGVFGVHLHHEEKRLSSQSTRTTPGMS